MNDLYQDPGEFSIDASPHAPISVLLIEDEGEARRLLSVFLKELGYEVRTSASGEEGLLAQRESPADIVLTDIHMQGISGMDVLRRVREGWPHTEVILITGYATVEAAIEALRHGAYDLLLKPVRLEQIESVVQHCEERIRYARENLELRKVVDQLRELSTRKEKFVALANHELRTPTAAACGFVSLLKKKAESLPPDAADLVERADTALQQLRDVVNDIGDLAMSRNDGEWLKRTPTRLGDLCADLHALSDRYAELRSLDLGVALPSDGERVVQVDRSKLVRAVNALLQNAVKYTPDGGNVEVRMAFDERNLEFTVTDSGVGVPNGESKKIFDLFYTVGSTSSHRSSGHEFGGGGLGIGLPLARTIARAHEGDVRYRPREGGGSIFTLTIPA